MIEKYAIAKYSVEKGPSQHVYKDLQEDIRGYGDIYKKDYLHLVLLSCVECSNY